MSRMLEALRTLEERRQRAPYEDATARTSIGLYEGTALESGTKEFGAFVGEDDYDHRSELRPSDDHGFSLSPPPAAIECCTLPTETQVPGCYLDMARRICEQVSSSYCNVSLFVSTDRLTEPQFSMTLLAQAFAYHSPGDILLVDGDLRYGSLSKSIGSHGPGMTEAMLGVSDWLDLIHATNSDRIDFVACGNRAVPTLERPEFGWGALRPKYRAVLIGVSPASEPETTWLASRCDSVYLLIARAKTKRRAASGAINALRACGATVLGSVVIDG